MKKIILSLLALSLTLSACTRQAPEVTEASTEPVVSVTEESNATDPTQNSDETIVPAETDDGLEETHPKSVEREIPKSDAGSDQARFPQESPTVPQTAPTEEVPETEPVKPAETIPPVIPAPTQAPEPEVPAETVPDAAEAPKACQHQWIPIQNIPAEYENHSFVLCSCGARFSSSDEWSAHRDSFLNTDNLASHTGYSSGSEKTELSPAMTVWQCSQCGATKTINSWDNP